MAVIRSVALSWLPAAVAHAAVRLHSLHVLPLEIGRHSLALRRLEPLHVGLTALRRGQVLAQHASPSTHPSSVARAVVCRPVGTPVVNIS
jgi:hypothetical protein